MDQEKKKSARIYKTVETSGQGDKIIKDKKAVMSHEENDPKTKEIFHKPENDSYKEVGRRKQNLSRSLLISKYVGKAPIKPVKLPNKPDK